MKKMLTILFVCTAYLGHAQTWDEWFRQKKTKIKYLGQQIAALQNLEQTAALTDGLNSFQRFLQMASGSALIGRTVKGTTADGEAVEGVVTRVTLENGQVIVVAGDRELPLDSVTEIRPATA